MDNVVVVIILALVIYGWMLVDLNRRYAKMHRDLCQAFGLVGNEIKALKGLPK